MLAAPFVLLLIEAKLSCCDLAMEAAMFCRAAVFLAADIFELLLPNMTDLFENDELELVAI